MSVIKINVFLIFRNNDYKRASQLLWANTGRVGCGRSRGRNNKLQIICNYAETGNVEQKSMFLRGKACSQCECDEKYRSLCVSKDDDRTFVRPYGKSYILRELLFLLYNNNYFRINGYCN